VPRLCEFYPGICLTTEEKVRKNRSQDKKPSKYSIHITHYKTHSYTHTRIHILQNNIKPPQHKLKQNAYRQTNIMGRKKSTQFLILLIHRYSTPFLTGPSLHFTALHLTSLYFTNHKYSTRYIRFNSLHCTTLHFTSLHFTSLHFTSQAINTLHGTPDSLHYTSLHFTSLHFTALHLTSFYQP
jgi:hypothetical protein